MKKIVKLSGIMIFLGCFMLSLVNQPQTNLDSSVEKEKVISIDPIHPPVLLPSGDNQMT